MGLFDSFRSLAKPFDEEYDDIAEKPKETIPASRFGGSQEEDSPANRNNKVVNIHATAQLQVVLVKPEQYENAREIADHLREKRTVVLNLESANKEISRRMVDFLSGVAYALEGKIKKVAISTYIITPYNVDIIGDVLDELENNGVHF